MRDGAPIDNLQFAGRLAAATLACMALAAGAVAGPRYSVPGVQIFVPDDAGGYAEGTLGGTRNTPNNIERISCTVTRDETVSSTGTVLQRGTRVFCVARNAAGRTVSCSSDSDAIANGLNGLSNDGLLRFSFDGNARCTDILVYESSSLEVKR